MKKGLLLAGIHLALLASLGAKLLIDRATLPRVWVQTTPIDPSLPIRGRYLSLGMNVEPRGPVTEMDRVLLRVENGRLVAVRSDAGARMAIRGRTLADPIAFFIPEHAPDPSRRPAGEELWAEVTVPKKGLPRPIRLGVKKDGTITPLNLN